MPITKSPSSPDLSAVNPVQPPEMSQLLGRNSNLRTYSSADSRGRNDERTPHYADHNGHRAASVAGSDVRRTSISAVDLNRHGYGAQHQHERPFFQKLLSSRFTVLNPNSSSFDLTAPGHGLGLESMRRRSDAEDFEDHPTRMSILSVFRPEKLIGNYERLAEWRDGYVANPEKIRNKKLRKFYENQNYLIERFEEIDHFLDHGQIHLNMLTTYTHLKFSHDLPVLAEDSELGQEAQDMAKSNSKSRINDLPGNIQDGGQFLGYDEELTSYQVHLAIMVNFFVNFVLLVGKIVISVLTNSLSVIASLVDSILDFLSTFIIYVANKLSNTKSWRTQIAYPIGRAKLEPLGILIFLVIIIISFFQVGLESFKKLFLSPPEEHFAVRISLDAIVIMLSTIIAKVGCWWWCATSKSSSVQALAQDAMTDIVFNTVSLIMPTAGYIFEIWWLDPLGAFLLSLYVIVNWSITAFEHIDNLTGAVASPQDYQIVLYLAYRFAECIKQITALKVYHAGDKLNVEIDLVFDTENFDLSFRDVHDIAEALQYAIETLPMVERAFVHIDYMEGNFKGHLN